VSPTISTWAFDSRLCSCGIVGATDLGCTTAEDYPRKKGVSTEAFLAGFGKPIDPREYG
jgi:hypothetical protein